MKILIKFFSVAFLIGAIAYVFSNHADAAPQKNNSFNFLIVGFDDSPANTDVISVASYDSESNSIRILQIPRDTYINYGDKLGKINGFYSYNVNFGKSDDAALLSLSDKISDLLGIEIDGYVALTFNAFVEFVDYIGGVSINRGEVPEQLRNTLSDENGVIHLDGSQAINFVRYRKNYDRGDLERLDVQKVFIKALFSRLKERSEVLSVFKFITKNEEVCFNIDKRRSLLFFLQSVNKISDADFQIATLPGKALKNGGIWYYVVNKPKAEELIMMFFSDRNRGFDEKNSFIYDF